MGLRPPVVARSLVRVLVAPEDRDFLLQDLDDRFAEIARSKGVGRARRWYWSQTLRAVPGALLPDVDLIRRSIAGATGDLRVGTRALRRRPLYAVGVAGTLGLGLAAALITFAVAWRVWLAPLPVPDPDSLVRLYEIEPANPITAVSPGSGEGRRHLFTEALLGDFRSHPWRTLEGVSEGALCDPPSPWTLDGRTYNIASAFLSPEGFAILGIAPILGRLPVESETEVLLSEHFWRSAFGGDPAVVGSDLAADYGSVRVVGIARMSARCPLDADILGVIDRRPGGDRDVRFLSMVARVKPEHSVADAEAEMNAFMSGLAEIHPEHRGWRVDAVPLSEDLIRPFRSVIVLLLAAGGTFLLLAGVNVLGLVAARQFEGYRDRSIRLALGASEGQLLRGSLVEALVFGTAGAVTGVLIAYWSMPPLRSLVPHDVPRLAEVVVTPHLALSGLAIGIVLGGAIGALGYLVSRGATPVIGRATDRSTGGIGWRHALIVGQVALTTLLTAAAATILHRVSTLRGIDLGFEAEGVSVTAANLGESSRERWDVLRTMLQRLDARGISAAAAFNTPMYGAAGGEDVPLFEITRDGASENVFYELLAVTPRYFSLMGIELLAGRTFQQSDDATAAKVAIVSEHFVDQYFPEATSFAEVLGRTLEPVMLLRGPALIIGVVRSTRHQGPDIAAPPSVYITYAQQGSILPAVSLLFEGEPNQLSDPISELLVEVTPGVDWSPLVPYTSYVSEWYAPFRFQLLVIGLLALLGLLLAALGLYSLMAYQVAIHRKEIGIRKALGARDGFLMLGVVARGTAMAVAGAIIGLAVWHLLLPTIQDLVGGFDSGTVLVPVSVALVVGGACVLATLLPAVRATRVDPVVTLKAD